MNRDFDITQNIRAIEELKVRLLSDITALFENMRLPRSDENKINEALADLLLSTYLLSQKTGISCHELDMDVLRKLRLEILNNDFLFYEAQKLSEHLRR